MTLQSLQNAVVLVTRLNFEPGPTPWHGLSLADYPVQTIVHCFAATFAIFLVHWNIYRYLVHGVQAVGLRAALAAGLVASYLLAVLYLHPWQPYWIRELSVMLSQLFAWKIADLALLRHNETLPQGFWSFILFDILVLRPTALTIPGRPSAPAGGSDRRREGGPAVGGGPRGAVGEADVTPLNAPHARATASCRQHGREPRQSGVKAVGSDASLTDEFPPSDSSSTSTSSGAGDTGTPRSLEEGQQAAASKSGGVSERTAPEPLTGTMPVGAAGTAAAAVSGRAVGPWPRLRLAASCLWGPLADFLLYYNACEAVNAYLMHRRAEDILRAPLLAQAWLSGCFASTLYFHLTYFFHSMELLWVLGFALAAGLKVARWEPLFNYPVLSTSPVDFWNHRWHQAFRWWWTRLVFLPVRRSIQNAFDRIEHLEEPNPTAPLDQRARCAAEPSSRGSNRGSSGGSSRVTLPETGIRRQRPRAQDKRVQADCCSKQPPGRRSGGAGGGKTPAADRTGTPDPLGRRWQQQHRGQLLWTWLLRNRKALCLAVPTVGVFLFSALFHEVLLWINFGRPTGEQAAFFLLHAGLLLVQRAAEAAAPHLTASLAASVPAPLRAATFMSSMALSSVLFFRPWFRASYHRELRVLFYGPTGWAARVWGLGLPRGSVRLDW